jgi:hypothetical protein
MIRSVMVASLALLIPTLAAAQAGTNEAGKIADAMSAAR